MRPGRSFLFAHFLVATADVPEAAASGGLAFPAGHEKGRMKNPGRSPGFLLLIL